MLTYDIVVVGGGPAGLAAAIEAKKNGCDSILLVERAKELGGILQQCIHNGFGLHIFKEDLTGPEYAECFISRLRRLKIAVQLNTLVLDISEEKVLSIVSSQYGFQKIQAKAIVLTMGCRERTRGSVNIPGTRPAGIFTAGTAQHLVNIDGYMIGKRILIMGSGDVGLIMARRLTLEGAEVLAVLGAGPYPKGLMRNVVQCLDDFNIPLLLNHTVIEIRGNERIEEAVVAQVDQRRNPIAGTEKVYECDTLLLSLGLIPENELSVKAGIHLDPVTLGPVVNEAMETSLPGVFACGNVLHVHDLVDHVTKEAQRAGKNAATYAQSKRVTEGTVLETKAGKGVRYVIPQRIRVNPCEGPVELRLRVDSSYTQANLVVRQNGHILKKSKKRYLMPEEMQTVLFNPDALDKDARGSIEVAVEEEEA